MCHPRNIPLCDVTTGQRKTLGEAASGRKCLVEFWSLDTENGPRTLDVLQIIAGSTHFASYQFMSVCCTTMEDFKNLMAKNEDPSRWNRLSLFVLWLEDEEVAREAIDMTHYPHYAAFSSDGSLSLSSKTLNLTLLP